MKKSTAIIIVAACLALSYGIGSLVARNMKNNEPKPEYIGPAEVTVENGVLSPEILLSFGRLSDPQLSPDGSRILYGVSYTSVADN